MRNLLNFLLKYNNLIVFLILEGICLSLLSSANEYHKSRVVKGIRGLTRNIETALNKANTYLNLREINSSLVSENTALRNNFERFSLKGDRIFFSVSDSLFRQNYQYTAAEVINNSVNKQKNFFTLNKGKSDGLSDDMAVTAEDGVAGVIVGCSDNFSVAISLLNIDFRLSARIKRTGHFGSLSWDGKNYRRVTLREIPQHVNVMTGDTVETTGFSSVFPEGIMVGKISDFEKRGSDFYVITVELLTDFKKLHHVSVIGNMTKTEQFELEKQFQ